MVLIIIKYFFVERCFLQRIRHRISPMPYSLFIAPQHVGSGDYNRSLSRFMHLAFCCMLALP